MEPFISLTGVAAPLLQNDINTDQIAPAGGHGGDADHGRSLFSTQRFRDDGSEDPEFVLNQPQYREAKILVAGENFACGSSRESAVWALAGFGITCIVAISFADIFRENCLRNGVLTVVLPEDQHRSFSALVEETAGRSPFTADLNKQTLTCPEGQEFPFEIAAAERHALLNGLDDIGLTLEHEADIAAWEKHWAEKRPWLQTSERPR